MAISIDPQRQQYPLCWAPLGSLLICAPATACTDLFCLSTSVSLGCAGIWEVILIWWLCDMPVA